MRFHPKKKRHSFRCLWLCARIVVECVCAMCGTEDRWASAGGTEKKKPRGRPFPRKIVSASNVSACASKVPATDVYAADDENMPPHLRLESPVSVEGEVVQPCTEFPAGLPIGIVIAQL